MLFLELPIINLETKRIKIRFKLLDLNSNLALTLGDLNPALNNPAQNLRLFWRRPYMGLRLCPSCVTQNYTGITLFNLILPSCRYQ